MHASPRTALLATAALVAAGLTAPAAHADVPDPAYTFVKVHGDTDPEPFAGPYAVGVADGKLFTTNRALGSIRIEDLATGQVTNARHDLLAPNAVHHLEVHDGELWVPSENGDRLLVLGLDGTHRRHVPVRTNAAVGEYAFGGGVALAPDGTIYAAVEDGDRVVVLPPGGGAPHLLGGSAGFGLARDVAVAPDGSVYVVDTSAHEVRRFSASGQLVGTLGEGAVEDGGLSFPHGVTVDAAGLVYVSGNARVQVYDATGTFRTSIGPADGQPGSLVGGAPRGVAFDPSGRVYVANGSFTTSDSPANRVISFDPALAAWDAPTFPGGTVAFGVPLTVTRGTWPGGIQVRIEWLRSGKAIPGATALTYTPTAADAGHTLSVRVTGLFGARGSVPFTFTAGTLPKVDSTVRLAKAKARAGTKPKVKVTVAGPDGAPLTGTVTVRRGKKVLATKKLKASHRGTVTVRLPKRKVGKPALRATFSGNISLRPSSSAKATLTVRKAKPKVRLTLAKKKVAAGAPAKVRVRVKAKGFTGAKRFAKPRGTLVIRAGKKKIATVKLKAKHGGKITVRLPVLQPGKHKIKVTYRGTKQIAKKTSTVKVLRVVR